MSSAILPGKFESGDIVVCLREFDACAEANGWKAEDKIKKLPAFLRGQAASHFYAIPEDDRKSYDDASKGLKEAFCLKASRENYFAESESRMLRRGEICVQMGIGTNFIESSANNRSCSESSSSHPSIHERITKKYEDQVARA